MWIDHPWELFSLDIMPDLSDSSSVWVNKITRSLLIILLIMWYFNYSNQQLLQMLIVGILIAILIYAMTNKKEKFSTSYINMNMEQTPVSELNAQPFQTIIKPMGWLGGRSREMFSETPTPSPESVSPESASSSPSSNSPSPNSASPSSNSSSPQYAPRETWMPRDTFRGYQPVPEKTPIYYTPFLGENKSMKKERVLIAPRLLDPQYSVSETNFPVDENPIQNLGGMMLPKERERRFKETRPTNLVPESDLSSTRMFLQDIQPNQYSISNDRTPVNASIGISYTPQLPPVSKSYIETKNGNIYPLFSRIDPELVRDDVSSERKEEQPLRDEWSAQLPSSNPLNETTLYDPRFTGYGDSAKAYYDSELGQIRYYYTDVDAYRSPNFIVRNKIDHVDFKDPMGKVSSMYDRSEALDDVTEQVNTDWMSKSTEFREDIMERLMRKNNAMNWQMRHAPLSKGSRLSSFTSSY